MFYERSIPASLDPSKPKLFDLEGSGEVLLPEKELENWMFMNTFSPDQEARIRAILNNIASSLFPDHVLPSEPLYDEVSSQGGVKVYINKRTKARHLIASPDRLFFEVWSRPIVKIASEIGVSDRAISKRCVREKIPTPPNGYWAKIESGISHAEALFQLGWTCAKIEELGKFRFTPDRIKIIKGGTTMPDNQQESTVFNDCGEKIIVKKISTTKAGNFNLCIHHGDPLLDDEVMFTLSKKTETRKLYRTR
jgi:hypothetical protein